MKLEKSYNTKQYFHSFYRQNHALLVLSFLFTVICFPANLIGSWLLGQVIDAITEVSMDRLRTIILVSIIFIVTMFFFTILLYWVKSNFIRKALIQYKNLAFEKISEKNIDKAEQELTYAKRQRVPDVSVAGGYAWQAHRNAPNDYGGAFVGFNMDLPVLYNFTPEIQKAQIFLERSKAGKKAYEHQLKYELKKDFNTFKYSAENMEYSKKILQDSEKIVKLSTDGYISGKNSYTDLVINENGHQEVLSQYLNAMSRHFYSYLELMQDIGHDILIEEDLL